jgi:hypothetical protein
MAPNVLPSRCRGANATPGLLHKGEDMLTASPFADQFASRTNSAQCIAVAHFDNLYDYRASSSHSIRGGPIPSAQNHSTLMVGLGYGTVYFMEFRV